MYVICIHYVADPDVTTCRNFFLRGSRARVAQSKIEDAHAIDRRAKLQSSVLRCFLFRGRPFGKSEIRHSF